MHNHGQQCFTEKLTIAFNANSLFSVSFSSTFTRMHSNLPQAHTHLLSLLHIYSQWREWIGLNWKKLWVWWLDRIVRDMIMFSFRQKFVFYLLQLKIFLKNGFRVIDAWEGICSFETIGFDEKVFIF